MAMKRLAMRRHACLLACVAMIGAASGQNTFYYCDKGGKKLVSDMPCENQGAKTTKKRAPEELYPISSGGGGLSDSERRQVRRIDTRLSNEDRQHQKRMQKAAERYAKQQQDKQRACDKLYRQKEKIAAQQRFRNTGKLNEQYQTINEKLHEKGC